MTTEIVQIRTDQTDINPPLWRRIKIAETATLVDLHGLIQAAMGWEDYHLHMFETSFGRFIPLEDAVALGDMPNC